MRTTPVDEGCNGTAIPPSAGFNTSSFAFATNTSTNTGTTVSMNHTGAANAIGYWYAQMIVSAEL